MDHSAEFRRCLQALDVRGIRRLWALVSPHLPQPKTDEDALTTLHFARTQCESLAFKPRAYSHKWLTERGVTSMLPDKLKPRAERLYPRVVSAVGICVAARSPDMKPAAAFVQQAMSDAVEDSYAHGVKDPVIVRERMMDARAIARRQIFGPTGLVSIPSKEISYGR